MVAMDTALAKGHGEEGPDGLLFQSLIPKMGIDRDYQVRQHELLGTLSTLNPLGHKLEKERVSRLHREVEKLDESARRAHAPTAQLQAEVRELSAALAAAREQRNQASRDAEHSRVTAVEASD